MPSDWYLWHPTCDHGDKNMPLYCERFLSTLPAFNQCALFFVYGHSFDLTRDARWPKIEELFQTVGGRDDVWYATNIEICDYIAAFKQLIMSADGNYIYNPTVTTLSLIYSDRDFINSAITLELKPGEHVYLDGSRA
jgi:hypothetical protein